MRLSVASFATSSAFARSCGPKTLSWMNPSVRSIAGLQSRPRVLFCGIEFRHATDETKRMLPGWDVVAVDRSKVLSTLTAEKFDVIVPLMSKIDSSTIHTAAQRGASLIQQFGTGLEGVDREAAAQAGIPVQNISSLEVGNAASCAEFVFFQLLTLLRRPGELAEAIRNRQLGTPMGKTLLGRTALLIGYGAIGKELSIRFQSFGVRVLAFRDKPWPEEELSLVDGGASFAEHGQQGLIDLAKQASIIAVCCPLNHRTFGIVDGKVLSAVPAGSYVVNVGRGGVVEQQALLDALESRHLAGAAVDVYWKEPFDPEDAEQGGARAMLQMQDRGFNVLCSPHVAGVTEVSIQGIAERFAQRVRDHMLHRAPRE